MKSFSVFVKSTVPGIIIALVSGCGGLPTDLGRGDVDTLLTERGLIVDRGDPSTLIMSLTAIPLTPDSCVRIALVNSPRLRSAYASLGLAVADVYAASRIRNPMFSASLLNSDVAGERDQFTLGLVTSVADLITLRARKRLSTAEFAVIEQSVGAEVFSVAAEAEIAYYNYVAAKQAAALKAQIAKATELSASLAQRYHIAGNISAGELALERAAASEARLGFLEGQAQAYEARTELATVLGFSVGDTWDAPAQLHLPVSSEEPVNNLIETAMKSRLDLASVRARADLLADKLGVVNWTRWLGDLELGIESERETDGARLTGPVANWELPIFNQHKDEMLRANADLQIAIADVQRISVDVDNSVRLSYVAMNNARERVDEYRNQLIPQRIEAVTRAQERVNFMLAGVFELIAIKQREYDAYQGYLEAIRDYWIARTRLGLAVGTVLPGSGLTLRILLVAVTSTNTTKIQ